MFPRVTACILFIALVASGVANRASLSPAYAAASSPDPEQLSQTPKIRSIVARCQLLLDRSDPDPSMGSLLLSLQVRSIAKETDGSLVLRAVALAQPRCEAMVKAMLPAAAIQNVGEPHRRSERPTAAWEHHTWPSDTAAEASIEPLFPWPPPQPFLHEVLPRRAFSPRLATLEQIAARLQSVLQAAGYSGFRFFAVGKDGFALVTRIERVDGAGRPAPNAGRWTDIDQASLALDSSFSVRNYLIALFGRRAGYFRVFVIIVAPIDLQTDPKKQLDAQIAQEWQRRGALALPVRFGRLPFSDKHRIYVLLYQFKKEEEKSPMAVVQGTVRDHLHATGVKFEKNQ